MTSLKFNTVQEVMKNVELFIQTVKPHETTRRIKTAEDKEKVYALRKEYIDKILGLKQTYLINATVVGAITGVRPEIFYSLVHRRYNEISTERLETMLKYLVEFILYWNSHTYEDSVSHFTLLRQNEIIKIPEIDIKHAAVKEIKQLMDGLMLTAGANLFKQNGFNGAARVLVQGRLEVISLRKILELLLYLRNLKAVKFTSLKAERFETLETKKALLEKINALLISKNLSVESVVEKGICKISDFWRVRNSEYELLGLVKVQRILKNLEQL